MYVIIIIRIYQNLILQTTSITLQLIIRLLTYSGGIDSVNLTIVFTGLRNSKVISNSLKLDTGEVSSKVIFTTTR